MVFSLQGEPKDLPLCVNDCYSCWYLYVCLVWHGFPLPCRGRTTGFLSLRFRMQICLTNSQLYTANPYKARSHCSGTDLARALLLRGFRISGLRKLGSKGSSRVPGEKGSLGPARCKGKPRAV